MFFTQEDYNKIEKYLQSSGKRDTSFVQSNLPLIGDELVAIVQDDTNKVLTIDELGASISQYISIEGFLYKGIATPRTEPPKKSKSLFWIAGEEGTYTHLGGFELDGTLLYIIKNNDGVWEADSLGVRLDAIDIANTAKEIADRSLSISSKLENDVSRALDKASNAEEVALTANNVASTALDKANAAIPASDRGKPGGVPILDSAGLVPKSQLPIVEIELVNSYLSDRVDAAPTASALHDLYKYHEGDIVILNNTVNAILDFVKDSSEIGVYPVDIKITSAAQDVNVQVICNGAWRITEIPDHVVASPLSGTGNSSINLAFKANSSESTSETGSIKIENDFGKNKIIQYTQYAASAVYKYEVSVTPNPISVQAQAGSGELTVVSTKTPYINNAPSGPAENVAFTVSKPTSDTWYTLGGNNNTTYTYTENTLEAPRSSTITISQDEVGGKSITASITQARAEVTTTYAFTIAPPNLSITDTGIGGVYPAQITSTKTTVVNGASSTEQVDYVVSYGGDASTLWVTYNKPSNNITVKLNGAEASRTGSIVFTQSSPSAPKITVPITQAGAVVTWNYIFEYTPTSMTFGNSASSKQYTVSKSIKQKLINGSPTGEELNVAWDASISGEGFTLNKETSTISVTINSGESSRSGTLLLSREEVGASGNKTIALTQEAGVVTWSYSLSGSINPTSLAAKNGTTILTVASTKQKYINGVASGTPVNVSWHGTSINDYLTGTDVSGSTWTMKENRTESSRSDTLVINQLEEGGKTYNIPVVQVAATVAYNYTFDVTPKTVSAPALGVETTVSISSLKQKTINGTAEGSPTSVNFVISEGTSWIGLNSLGTLRVLENRTEAERSHIFSITQNESGKSSSVYILQEPAFVQYDYNFDIQPRSLTFPYGGDTKNITTTSTRQKYVNGTAEGSPTAVNVTKTANGNGFTANGTTSITATANTAAARNHSFTYTQDISIIARTITCSQEAGVIGYNYYMSVNPTTLTFPALGNTQSVNVSCYRKKTINGTETGESETVGYTSKVTGTGFSIVNTSIEATENKGALRTGSVTFTAISGGKTATVALSQAAATITYKYYFTVSPTTLNYTSAASTKSVTVSSYKNTVINGTEQTDRIPVTYTYTNRQDWQTITDLVNIAVTKNPSTTVRTSVLSYVQAESTDTKQVAINQDAMMYNYYLTVTPTSLDFAPEGGTKSVTITSNKKEVIGGIEQPGITPVGFTSKASGTGFSVDSGGTRITATNNIGAGRSGKVTYTQNEGSKTAECVLFQETSNPLITMHFMNGMPNTNYYLFDSAGHPLGDPNTFDAFMSGESHDVPFYKKEGITVNQAYSGSETQLYVGDSLIIKASRNLTWLEDIVQTEVPDRDTNIDLISIVS